MDLFRTHDGVGISYEDRGGEGFPLVMMHGWSQTQAMFKWQANGLPRSHRVITFDHRGHGRSEKPHYGYRIARLAQDLWELVEQLELDRFDLLGWSMGASVAWSFIDHYGTGRIRKLVIVDQPAVVAAVPWMTSEERAESGATIQFSDLLDLASKLRGPEGASVARAFERTMFSGEVDPDLWEFIEEEIGTVPKYVSVPLLLDHGAQDWRDVLPRIDVPTLVIGCEGSHVTPASQRYLAERIPGAEIKIFPSTVASSHFPFLQNPAAFNEAVSAFLGTAEELLGRPEAGTTVARRLDMERPPK